MAITTAQSLNIADNIAKTLLDIETDFITNPGGTSPTVAAITSGQTAASNSLAAKIAALSAPDQAAQTGQRWVKTANKIIGYLTVPVNTLYLLYADLFYALDTDLPGVADFCVNNSLQVHAEFAAAFNYVAANGFFLGLNNYFPTPIQPGNIFPRVAQNLATIAVTGAAAGTVAAGTALDLTKYAPEQLYIKNTAGVPSVGTATSFTITFSDNTGNTAASATQALGGALAAGAFLAVGTKIGSADRKLGVKKRCSSMR